MSRQVDVKALVSHIVRGDGVDKCRICMGDTTEGQVYLEDTVMMDGEKPVTLAEIVESITGVEVLLDKDLPPGLCPSCAASATAAGTFRIHCRQSTHLWNTMVDLLQTIPEPDQGYTDSGICVFLEGGAVTILDRNDVFKTDYDETDHFVKTAVDVDTELKNIEPDSYYNIEIDTKEQPRTKILPIRRRIGKPKTKKVHSRCKDCDKEFKLPRDFYEHYIDSTDLKRACFICASIMTHQELIKHLKVVHNTEVNACKKCPSLHFTLKQYKLHLERSHMFGDFRCGDCGRRFQTQHAFIGHTSMHVVKKCPICDKLFRNHRCYVYHVKNCCNLDMSRNDIDRTKTKVLFEVKNKENRKIKIGARGSIETECICDYCNKKFAGKKFVCAHIQIVHMRNTHQPCPFCGKSLAAAHMSQHIKSHNEKELFTCVHCGLTLKTKLGFTQHLRLHTGEKPYRCQHCNETFSASSRKSEHIRKVHKSTEQIVLKYVCELCPARFRLPFSLKKHITTVHENVSQGQEGLFECPDCLVKFSSFRGMLCHRRTHSKSKHNDTAVIEDREE